MERAWLALLAGLVPLLAGCYGSWMADVPSVTNASVIPAQLRFVGGEVSIVAMVTSTGQIAQVRARIQGPAGIDTVELTPNGGRYEATFTAPANEAEAAVVYTVTVTATDTQGRTSSAFAAGEFTVKAMPRPPAEPPGW